jgi:hypothetical protein
LPALIEACKRLITAIAGERYRNAANSWLKTRREASSAPAPKHLCVGCQPDHDGSIAGRTLGRHQIEDWASAEDWSRGTSTSTTAHRRRAAADWSWTAVRDRRSVGARKHGRFVVKMQNDGT